MTIESLMTKNVVSVSPETPLVEAVDILLKNNFSGLPVVDANNVLVGILTEYDLTIKGSAIYLPTFIKLLQEFKIYKQDQGLIKDDIKNILKMRVGDIMNREPLALEEGTATEDVIKTFSEHHRVNPIPVVTKDKKLVGIISRYDLIKLLGAPSITNNVSGDERELDRDVNKFLKDFESRFILVSGVRTHYWFIVSILFALVGFFIAFAIILRIGSS